MTLQLQCDRTTIYFTPVPTDGEYVDDRELQDVGKAGHEFKLEDVLHFITSLECPEAFVTGLCIEVNDGPVRR